MASALFNPGREGFLLGEIDWDLATMKCSLIRGYTFNGAHKFVSDVTTASGVLVADVTLGTKTGTAGTADAADITFTAVPTGAACNALIIYQASAVGGGADVLATAQRLIAFLDNANVTGLPVTPNGGNINVVWDSGTNKIFTL